MSSRGDVRMPAAVQNDLARSSRLTIRGSAIAVGDAEHHREDEVARDVGPWAPSTSMQR